MPTRNQIQISLLHTNTVQYKDKYRSTRVTFLSLACSGPHGNRLEWVNCQIGSSDRQSTCMHRVLITSYHWDPGLWEQFSTKRKKSSKPFHNPNQSWTNRKTSPAKSKEVVNKDRKEQSSPFHKVVSSCPKENSVALDQNDHQVCPNFRPCVKTRWRRVSLGKASLFPSSTCVFVCVCVCVLVFVLVSKRDEGESSMSKRPAVHHSHVLSRPAPNTWQSSPPTHFSEVKAVFRKHRPTKRNRHKRE